MHSAGHESSHKCYDSLMEVSFELAAYESILLAIQKHTDILKFICRFENCGC